MAGTGDLRVTLKTRWDCNISMPSRACQAEGGAGKECPPSPAEMGRRGWGGGGGWAEGKSLEHDPEAATWSHGFWE